MNEQIILSRLLDKYEKSKHLREPGTSKRRVMLRIEKKELPEYDYQNAQTRDAFNAAAQALARRHLIETEWVSARPVLSAVVLNLESVEACYALCKRIHPQKQAEAIADLVGETLGAVSTGWIAAWRDDTCRNARELFAVPSFCKEEPSLLSALLTALVRYDALAGETLSMRAFSSLCYHDTKFFERTVREPFLRIAAKYDPGFAEACEQPDFGVRDQLAYLGIYARPELYEFSGDLKVETRVGIIDYAAALPFGLGLPSTLVDEIRLVDLSAIRRITFIENKTNYDEYLITEAKSHEMVVYHGGFMSPQKRKLFARIAAGIGPNVTVAFWADIDLGGFRMFEQLAAMIPSLVPMRMSGEDVAAHRESGLLRTPAYMARLKQLCDDQAFPRFADAANRLLEYGITIEQEAFLQERNVEL